MFILKYGEQDECGRVPFDQVQVKVFGTQAEAEKCILDYARHWFGEHAKDLSSEDFFESTQDLADALIEIEEELCLPTFEFEIEQAQGAVTIYGVEGSRHCGDGVTSTWLCENSLTIDRNEAKAFMKQQNQRDIQYEVVDIKTLIS